MGKFIQYERVFLLTAAAIAGAVAGETAFGTFTDTRDGQTYKTVKIGEQTWMAQNLNYKTESGSWCYENKADDCKKYGRLYDWNTATTVCPKGWKLPSREDWDILVATAGGQKIGGEKLKSKSGWNENGNGTDKYGFSALPVGGRAFSFNSVGRSGNWWTATEGSASRHAYYRGMYYDNDGVDDYYMYKSYGYSVRCVADRP